VGAATKPAAKKAGRAKGEEARQNRELIGNGTGPGKRRRLQITAARNAAGEVSRGRQRAGWVRRRITNLLTSRPGG